MLQRHKLTWALAGLLACVLGMGEVAHAAKPVVVPGAQQLDLKASGNQRTYRVFVAIPDKPAPAKGYAALYVLDGNAMFLTALEAVRAIERRPDMPDGLATVVVGIGYPDGVDIGVARTFDLTPAGSGSPRIKAPSGGADGFLSFIERDLKPKLGGMAKIDPTRQGVFGHSFGGLFVLHALARQPGTFQLYIAASPSIWFADPTIRTELQSMVAKRKSADPVLKLLVMAGEYEQKPSPQMRAHPHAERLMSVLAERTQVDNGRAIAELVGKAPAIEARFDEIVGEDHGTVIPAAISRAVSFMLNPALPVPPVPTAQEYLRMSPEQRYDLRLRVRDLPDRVRIPWLNGLKKTLHEGLTAEQVTALHDERNQMDQKHGTRPHAVNASE